jgi:CspA family cold shock protein
MGFVPDPTLKDGGVALGGSMTGTVRWFKDEKGYGRITGDDGYVYFVHFSGIEMEGYRSLTEGQRVTFEWNGSYADHYRKAVANVRLI